MNELGKDGLLYGGGLGLLGVQAIGAGAVLVYSFVVSLVLALILKATVKVRVSEDDEVGGIDRAIHAEGAYEFGDTGGGGAFAGIGLSGLSRTEGRS